MIYNILLYDEGGKLILDISFEEELIDPDKVELLSGFLQALQYFSKTMLKGKPLKNVEFKGILIKIIDLEIENEIKIFPMSLAILYDEAIKNDLPEIIKVITDIIFSYKELFLDWDCFNLSYFKDFKDDLLNCLIEFIYQDIWEENNPFIHS